MNHVWSLVDMLSYYMLSKLVYSVKFIVAKWAKTTFYHPFDYMSCHIFSGIGLTQPNPIIRIVSLSSYINVY